MRLGTLELAKLAAQRCRAKFDELLRRRQLYDAELCLAGIFEVSALARAQLSRCLRHSSPWLMPTVVTDEGDWRSRWVEWRSFLGSCPYFWLETNDESFWARAETFGHGDAVEFNTDVSGYELRRLVAFPAPHLRQLFEELCHPEEAEERYTIAVWISSLDITVHIHFPTEHGQPPIRLNCIVLGSELQSMTFMGGMGRLGFDAPKSGEAVVADRSSLMRRAALDAYERLADEAETFHAQHH
ncbi:unnamed protein product [Durusdinium trenchii]